MRNPRPTSVALLLIACLAAGTPATAPSGVAPYGTPTVAQVTDVLERVRARLDAAIGTPRLLDAKTRQPIDDPARSPLGLAVDAGPEGKFNPLIYPMGVIHSGMLAAADATGDVRFAQFTARHMQFLADHLTGSTTRPATSQPGGLRGPFHALLAPRSLDDCGSMAGAMVKARLAHVGPDLDPVFLRAIDFVSHRQFRLPDGTLARHRPVAESVWADDMYMGGGLLTQAGRLTGNRVYFDDAAKQVLQISRRLWVPERKLLTHGWTTANPNERPSYFWGRANGWCLMTMAELLTFLPADHPDRAAILAQYRSLAQGVASVQAGDGLWHQLLDRPDSYTETSCSAMFAYAIARGVNQGWLDGPTYAPVALAAWAGIAGRVDGAGHVATTCIGTSFASDAVYYYRRPATDDIHGYGPVLLAGAEVLRLLHHGRLTTAGDPRNPIA